MCSLLSELILIILSQHLSQEEVLMNLNISDEQLANYYFYFTEWLTDRVTDLLEDPMKDSS